MEVKFFCYVRHDMLFAKRGQAAIIVAVTVIKSAGSFPSYVFCVGSSEPI